MSNQESGNISFNFVHAKMMHDFNSCITKGKITLSGTRVTLQSVVECFLEGLSPKEINLAFPSLPIEDIYVSIGFYLKNKHLVDSWLSSKSSVADEIQRKFEVANNG